MGTSVVYAGTVKDVTLDLLLYHMGSDFLRELWPYQHGAITKCGEAHVYPVEFTFGDPPEEMGGRKQHIDISKYSDYPQIIERIRAEHSKPQNAWSGKIVQSTATPRYLADWSFTGEDGRGEGWLFFKQWRAAEVELYGWYYERVVSEEFRPTFGVLVTWLSEHYDHDFRRLELTPEQEQRITQNVSEAEIQTIVREADLTYWKDVHRQAQASGNVRDFLDRRDIPRSTYYFKVNLYKL